MEGKFSKPGGCSSYGVFDLKGSTPVNHLQQHVHGLAQHHNQPLPMGQIQLNPMPDFGKAGLGRNSASEEDEASLNEGGIDVQSEAEKDQKMPVWHRVRWTDAMVKLLITALSYIDEDVNPFGRRRCLNQHKQGKWRTVSKVMTDRECCASPQQCEDKFNDLNKRYKKLNEILGRGTSCQVVENPALLDRMSHLSEKVKDEVHKILNSRQLFYEEMCSYHNANRLHLPPDPALQRSIQLALGSRDDHETDEDDHDGEAGDVRQGLVGDSAKRMRKGKGPDEFHLGSGVNLESQNQDEDADLALQKQRMEQQKLQIKMERLELEKQWFEWKRFNRKEDRELEKMKAENERMRLENEQMELELELKRMEMHIATE